ncbi:PilZ domain-containing protein [Halieaceae bacterium IMCC14734]|uniref:PilZ domain-containing protein n=1 Tax=Candidatus Litorirhabdus singularis TaxID=2518993 RepID=A0ABT3THD2_9GAMM|nr:PilZ domain-containing protein [Candidatus Litorirhabdus singularis]MCX2981732.1 PilZ domain-containing protein [Candidatus Litorirhabdus singularis]
MYERSGESLEFHSIETDEQLEHFARKFFRVRVRHLQGHYLRLGSLKLTIADVSARGISLVSDKVTAMVLGDLISNSELVLDQERFQGLSGRIVHHSLDGEGNTVTGIQWLELNTITEKRMEIVVESLRQKLFDDI